MAGAREAPKPGSGTSVTSPGSDRSTAVNGSVPQPGCYVVSRGVGVCELGIERLGLFVVTTVVKHRVFIQGDGFVKSGDLWVWDVPGSWHLLRNWGLMLGMLSMSC